MFIFLLAGHEVGHSLTQVASRLIHLPQTTAHTLCFSFGLLALFPDEQERLYQHIKGVMSSLSGTPVRSIEAYRYRAETSPRPCRRMKTWVASHILWRMFI